MSYGCSKIGLVGTWVKFHLLLRDSPWGFGEGSGGYLIIKTVSSQGGESAKMSVRKLVANLLGDLMLTVLAADLLYLFYAGAWHDPVAAIETAEAVALYALAVFGLVRFILHMKEAWRELPGMDQG